MIENFLELDQKIFYNLNSFRHPFLDFLIPYFSQKEILYGFYLLSGALFLRFKNLSLKIRLILLITLLSGFLVSDLFCGKVFKPLFKRERPFISLPKIYYYTKGQFKFLENPLLNKKSSFSFPSCHATNAGLASFYLSLWMPRGSPIFLVFALLVGYSRIYLGHHFPLDVLGGYFLGGIIALGLFKILRTWIKI